MVRSVRRTTWFRYSASTVSTDAATVSLQLVPSVISESHRADSAGVQQAGMTGRRAMLGVAALLVLNALMGCSVLTEGSGAPPQRTQPVARQSTVTVTRAELGDDWPLTIDSGILRCESVGSHVVLRAPDGTDYAINGSARGFADEEGWQDGVDILRDGLLPLHLQPLINRGLTLCD